MRRLLKNKKGFTLIELIVVIAILGILAVIAIPRLTGFQQTARLNADAAAFSTIESLISTLVANGDIVTPAANSTVILTTNAAGAVTFTGTATETDAAAADVPTLLGNRLTRPPSFQAGVNQSRAPLATWTIAPTGIITVVIDAAADVR